MPKKIKAAVAIVDDQHMTKLTAKYRGKKYLADVLSFTLNEIVSKDTILLGDIVINHDAAKRQAKKLGHSTEEEIAFLAAHAMMHLQGIHHEEKSKLKIQKSKV